jgi:hypothetical protein
MGRWPAFVGLALSILLAGSTAGAQQQSIFAPSDLARQNSDRVAASAGEIKGVLSRDPGLLIALKHMVAK